jgi:hypothetical protein
VESALQVLLSSESLPRVSEAAERIVVALGSVFGEHSMRALLVEDDDGWRVGAGVGLRGNERRLLVPANHWLVQRMTTGDSAVIVAGTDVARQELQAVPLIHAEHWLAVTLPAVAAIAVLAREANEPPFTATDALTARDVASVVVPLLRQALLTRELARTLSPYQT